MSQLVVNAKNYFNSNLADNKIFDHQKSTWKRRKYKYYHAQKFKWRKITKNIYKYWQTYSGSKYPAVPLTSNEAPLSPSCGAYLEKPRSVNLPHMLWSKRILLDFTSLCMMHRSEKVCRYNKPKSYRKENKIWQLSLIS